MMCFILSLQRIRRFKGNGFEPITFRIPEEGLNITALRNKVTMLSLLSH